MKFHVILQTLRPPFLILTPVCVFLGLSTTLFSGQPINISLFFLILAGAIFAHISVNMLNEYYDFKSGLDLKTVKTPFSGGSGALPEHPEMASAVFIFGLVALCLTVLIGAYFIFISDIQILPLGLVGLILIVTYTQWLNRLPLLCLIAPGLGFGILMVVGTHMILASGYSHLVWQVSLIPFFLINNLLLLNQYPDIKADTSIGRNTFPIAFGIKKSNLVYAIFMLASYSLLLFYIVMGYLPILSLIALPPIFLSLFSLSGAIKHTSNIGQFPHYMGANVAASILTPLLLSIAIISS